MEWLRWLLISWRHLSFSCQLYISWIKCSSSVQNKEVFTSPLWCRQVQPQWYSHDHGRSLCGNHVPRRLQLVIRTACGRGGTHRVLQRARCRWWFPLFGIWVQVLGPRPYPLSFWSLVGILVRANALTACWRYECKNTSACLRFLILLPGRWLISATSMQVIILYCPTPSHRAQWSCPISWCNQSSTPSLSMWVVQCPSLPMFVATHWNVA